MSEHREAMNEIHLSVALSKLANLPMFTQKNGLSLMSSLEGMLLEPRASNGPGPQPRFMLMKSREVGSGSWALAKAGRGSNEAFDMLLGHIEANDFYMLDKCNAHDLSNVVYACATSNRLSESFAEKLCAHITNSKCNLADFKP